MPDQAPAVDLNDLPPGATPDPTYQGDWVRQAANPQFDPSFETKPNVLMPPVLFRGPGGTGAGQNDQPSPEDLPPGAVPDTGQVPQRTAPALPPQTPAPGTSDFMKDVYSAGASGNAMYQHLMGNSMMLIDKTVDTLSDVLNIPKTQIFKHWQDIFEEKRKQSEATAEEYAKGREKDFSSNLNRSVLGGAITAAPWMTGAATGAALGSVVPGVGTVAGGVLGGILGQAGVSALSEADKGPAATGQAALFGAVQGGLMEVMGPAGRWIKVPVMVALQAKQLMDQGVPWSTALANSLGSSAIMLTHPGQMGTGETLRTMGRGVRELPQTIPRVNVDPVQSATAQKLIEQGAQHGVTLTAGDISQRPSLKNVEVSLEKVPGSGMQALRERQAGEAKAAAEGVKSQYEQSLLETDPSSSAELEQAALAGDQRARNVQEKLRQAGNDPDRIIQASIGLGDWTTRQTATKLYDEVQQLAEKNKLGDVPMDATGKALNSSLNQLMPAKLRNNAVIGLLEKIKRSISPELDEEGNPIKQPDNSYGLIRQLHSDLGDQIREYYKGNNALIGEKGVGYLERVQNALEDDMRNYAEKSNVPEIIQAGRTADEYYKTARVPYKNGMLTSAATSIEPDQIFQQFIKEGKRDRAQNFYDALDDKGRAAVRYNMVAQAVDNAINPQSGVFSPQKFFTAVDKLGEPYDVFFNAKDKAEIQGFKNLMGHVTRAGQYMENPPTGQRVIPYLIAGAGIEAARAIPAHPVMAGTGVALLGGLRSLFTTVTGRNLLLRAYGIKPGSPMMNSIWKQVGEEIGKGRPPEPPEEPPAGGGPAPGAPSEGPEGPTAGGQMALPFDQKMQNMADQAMQRIRDRGTFNPNQLNALVPLESMGDMAIWGAAKLAQGVKNKSAWMKEILDDVGEHADRFRPLLPELYEKSVKAYGRFLNATGDDLPNTKQLIRMFNEGRAGAEWYDKTREELHKVFGQKDGDLMIRLLAATSPNTTVPSNVTLALKAFQQMKQGEDFHGEGDSPGYLPVVKDMLRAIRDGGDEDAVGGLKVQSFRKNLLGETDPVTIDRWMKRIFNFKSAGSITDPQYKFMDYQVTRLAKKLDMQPRQVQAALWKAIRESSGETSSGAPFEELIGSRIAKSKVLSELVDQSRGEQPEAPGVVKKNAEQVTTPIRAYHGTTSEFEDFDPRRTGDIGMHFGTAEQAARALNPLGRDMPAGANIRPVDLYIKNPVQIPDVFSLLGKGMNSVARAIALDSPVRLTDAQRQNVFGLAKRLDALKRKAGGIRSWLPPEQSTLLSGAEKTEYANKTKQFWQAIQDAITGSGYDSAVYENKVEGKGKSYIVFDPAKVKPAFGASTP